MSCLPNSFFERDCVEVAQDLLGKKILFEPRGFLGEIVETEAYCAKRDQACHGFHGKTPRNASLFGPPGLIYVYQIYGIHHCINLVTGKDGEGAAVLIRAIRPIEGFEGLRELRSVNRDVNLCNGPGKLCQALDIDLGMDGKFLHEVGMSLQYFQSPQIHTGTRIGISKDAHLPWRFGVAGSSWLSRKI